MAGAPWPAETAVSIGRDERQMLDVLVRVGAEKRAASRAMSPGVPGRAAEPLWTTDYLHAELRKRGARITRVDARRALDNLAAARKVDRREGMRGKLMWGLRPRWDGWDG